MQTVQIRNQFTHQAKYIFRRADFSGTHRSSVHFCRYLLNIIISTILNKQVRNMGEVFIYAFTVPTSMKLSCNRQCVPRTPYLISFKICYKDSSLILGHEKKYGKLGEQMCLYILLFSHVVKNIKQVIVEHKFQYL